MLLRKDAKIELLKHVPLFSHCNKKQLAASASLAGLIELTASTPLTPAALRETVHGGSANGLSRSL